MACHRNSVFLPQARPRLGHLPESTQTIKETPACLTAPSQVVLPPRIQEPAPVVHIPQRNALAQGASQEKLSVLDATGVRLDVPPPQSTQHNAPHRAKTPTVHHIHNTPYTTSSLRACLPCEQKPHSLKNSVSIFR